MSRVRIRPSKSVSFLGMLGGIGFVLIGVFVVIPIFGPFGILWTSIAAVVAIFHAVNILSARGIATTEIEVEGLESRDPQSQPSAQLPFDERLRRLEQLRKDQLINEQEYQHKRDELMRSPW